MIESAYMRWRSLRVLPPRLLVASGIEQVRRTRRPASHSSGYRGDGIYLGYWRARVDERAKLVS